MNIRGLRAGGLLLFLLIPLALLLASCASRQVRETVDGDAALVQAVCLYNQGVHALEGEGVGIYRSRDRTLSFRARVIAYWPEMNVRLEVQDFVFKKPLVTLVRRESRIQAAVHPRRQYLEVDYQDADFAALTGLDFPRELIIPTLMGKVYFESGGIAGLRGNTLVVSGPSMETTVTLDRDQVPRTVEYRFADETLTVSFGRYLTEQGAVFPRKIQVASRDGSTTLEITYADVRLNKSPRTVSLLPEEWEGYERAP